MDAEDDQITLALLREPQNLVMRLACADDLLNALERATPPRRCAAVRGPLLPPPFGSQ